jgi:hypothetical protein
MGHLGVKKLSPPVLSVKKGLLVENVIRLTVITLYPVCNVIWPVGKTF